MKQQDGILLPPLSLLNLFVCFLQTYIAINRTPLYPRVVLKKKKTTKEEKFFEFNSSCSPLQLRGFPRDPFSSPEFLFFPTFFQISSSSRFQFLFARENKIFWKSLFSLSLSPSFFIARNVGKIWLVFFFFFYASMKFNRWKLNFCVALNKWSLLYSKEYRMYLSWMSIVSV